MNAGPGPRRVVIVGTGMAGLRVAEGLAELAPGAARITMLGEEPRPAYNRILLSKVLALTAGLGDLELRPGDWYERAGVDLRTATSATELDVGLRVVRDHAGEVHRFDALVLATGSRPFVPPIPGRELAHVHCFRTAADARAIGFAAERSQRAVVIGGGLLGLEAAAGLARRGARTTVVEVADRLMAQQLDHGAARMLARGLESLGLTIRTGRSVARIGEGTVRLDGDEELEADLVVVAAGIRPETRLAAGAGIETERGIVVDDEMRTSAPGVWAVGECAEHRGRVYGLWAPLADQAAVAAASVLGEPAGFTGAQTATTLKIAGMELFVGGVQAASAAEEETVSSDTRRRVYRKLVLSGDRLGGAIVLNDPGLARRAVELLRTRGPVPVALLDPGGPVVEDDRDDAAIVCSCNRVTRGELVAAIARDGLDSVATVARATRATTGCGSCAGEVRELLADRPDANGSSPGNTAVNQTKPEPATVVA